LVLCGLLISVGSAQAAPIYVQTNLITNDQSVVPAQQTDPNLINPWGFSFSTTSPLWVSDQGTAVATVYTLKGTTSSGPLLTAPIPNLGNVPPSVSNGPTGQVSTGAPGITTAVTDFQVNGTKAAFIFANQDGSIWAWRGGLANNTAIFQTSVPGASFTGLAIGNNALGAAFIYAADQNSGKVYVFNSTWQNTGTLTDPNGLPAGFTAFNVQNINGKLFVTYANPSDPNGVGGVVDEFTTDGTFVARLITDPTGTHLDNPWGIALAPTGWGQFGGDLLIGNNAVDGTINAYTPGGTWQGQIQLINGQLFSEQQLWALTFGSGSASGGSPNVLYFAAGFNAAATDGLVGALAPVPEPSAAVLVLSAVSLLAGGWTWKNARRRLQCGQRAVSNT
jgi:uncharacterized protein (TIGR03118 family)